MISEEPKNLFFNKSGEAVFGRVQPSAFAYNCPWPPSSTNLNKNKVYRPSTGETSRLLEEAQENLEREAEVEARKYGKGEESDETKRKDNFRRKIKVPEIELAIYWDRNPYRQRVIPNQTLLLSKQRSKSAANVSSLKELLDYTNLNGGNSNESCEKWSRENSQRAPKNGNGKEVHKEGCPAAESSRASITGTAEEVSGPEEQNQKDKQQPSENRRRSAKSNGDKELKDNENKSGHQSRRQSSSQVSGKEDVDQDSVKGLEKKGKLLRNRIKSVDIGEHAINNNVFGIGHRQSFEEEVDPEKGVRAVGLQVATDRNVSLAELRSIYLCPVHGHNAQKEKERQEKIERLATAVHPNNMSCGRCSRHHSQSRARARTASTNTKVKRDKSKLEELEQDNLGKANNGRTSKQTKAPRSKTAKSEYAGNFRHPMKLTPSYNRQLRNKILSYCFTKQSIF